MQEGKPVAFGSKTLTSCERNYANIEREMLAIVWGTQKFHTYVYGRRVIVETDHKPLESIFRKPLESRRAMTRLTLLYKMSRGEIDIDTDSFLRPHAESRTRASHSYRYRQDKATKNLYFYSFFSENFKAMEQPTCRYSRVKLAITVSI